MDDEELLALVRNHAGSGRLVLSLDTRPFATKLPFARSESRRTPVSALGLIVGSVMGPINPAKMGVRTTIKVRIAAT
jgi:hypothetical protein